MRNFTSILAAVDFSTGSRAALDEACRMAQLNGARLYILHVVDSMAVAALMDTHGGEYGKQAQYNAQGASAALGRWLAGADLPENHEALVVVGVLLHEILEHAQRWNADLIVAGVMGAGQVASGAGSVASKLARKAPGKVLLVAAQAAREIKRIVACVDFSDASRSVMAEAQHLAVLEKARVDFLHVWHEPWLMLSYDAPVADSTTEMRDRYIADLRRMLKDFIKDSSAAIDYHPVLINGTNHGKAIAEHAREVNADLIIVGAKGRTNLRYVLLGSTAERLLAHLTSSLLVVKEAEDQAD